MSKHATYVPKHRQVPEPTRRGAPRRALRTGLAMTSIAAAVTGVSIAGGVLGSPVEVPSTARDLGGGIGGGIGGGLSDEALTGGSAAAADLDREVVSRSSDRSPNRDRRADPAKVSALSVDSGPARTASVSVSDGDPRDIARALMPRFGFSADQFGCLDSLWIRESRWDPSAHNPSSGAHGIPQALPGSKMATAGPDWESDPVTQITWGLGYIRDRYGSPCGAWAHSESHGWY